MVNFIARIFHFDSLFIQNQVISVYCADVGMKMLYFGGFKDYVSKEWQRNYVSSLPLARVVWHTCQTTPHTHPLEVD